MGSKKPLPPCSFARLERWRGCGRHFPKEVDTFSPNASPPPSRTQRTQRFVKRSWFYLPSHLASAAFFYLRGSSLKSTATTLRRGKTWLMYEPRPCVVFVHSGELIYCQFSANTADCVCISNTLVSPTNKRTHKHTQFDTIQERLGIDNSLPTGQLHVLCLQRSEVIVEMDRFPSTFSPVGDK